jgi:ABC-2 type transport system ATP-binding protein
VTVELAQDPQPQALERFGYLNAIEGRVAHFIVPQEALTQTLSRLLAELDIADLTVTDPPVEEVIGRVFQSGGLENTGDRPSA